MKRLENVLIFFNDDEDGRAVGAVKKGVEHDGVFFGIESF